MPHQNVHTKLHILAENVLTTSDGIVEKGRILHGADHFAIAAMLKAASFVIDNEVLHLVARSDVLKSINAMLEAGIARLPYDPMVVEFQLDNSEFREFVLLKEGAAREFIVHYAAFHLVTEISIVIDVPVRCVLTAHGSQHGVNVFFPKQPNIAYALKRSVGNSVGLALLLALLMLNTKGIDKEVIEVGPALNKKRVASGKKPIPKHSVVHIGRIYRRDGTAIERPEGQRGGWHVTMHWRCGHTRNVPFGKGRTGRRLVYVPACIVNFQPDEKVVPPKREVQL